MDGNDNDILRYVKEENVLIGATAAGATILGPGYVFLAGMGPTHIGVRKGCDLSKAHPVVDAFKEAGFETYLSNDVMKIIWEKLLVNVGINALMALLNTRNGFIAYSQHALTIGRNLVTEGVAVAKAEGYIFNVEDIVDHYYIKGAKVVGQNRCSMLQDMDKKRKTEIDKINGVISRMGKNIGLQPHITI